MRSNRRMIIKILSYVLMILGAAMLLPGVVGFFCSETAAARVYLAFGGFLILAGFAGTRSFPGGVEQRLSMRDGFIVVASAWLILSSAGAVPFVISGDIPNYADAFFETASGFSTTGSTCLTDVEALTKTSLFWRSFSHWLGGMGILVMTIALLPRLGIGGQRLMRAETTGLSLDKSMSTFTKTARNLYTIYILMSLAETVLLMISGLNLYDALVHTFGTVGTGGFSSYNQSVGAFGSVSAELIIVVFMLLCGINFSNLELIFTGKIRAAFKDVELKAYLGIVGAATVFIAVVLYAEGFYSAGGSVRYSLFQVSSIITTTGYGTADFDIWPECCKIVIFALMFIGGCGGSTGGGIKVIRAVLLAKLIKRGASRKLHPNNVYPVFLGGTVISDSTVIDTCGFIGLYLFVAAASCFLLSFQGVDFTTGFSAVISALSNIGPGFNLVGPACNFAFFAAPAKILLGLLMIAGRLELFTMFVIFSRK